jgi:hypothetical protein
VAQILGPAVFSWPLKKNSGRRAKNFLSARDSTKSKLATVVRQNASVETMLWWRQQILGKRKRPDERR